MKCFSRRNRKLSIIVIYYVVEKLYIIIWRTEGNVLHIFTPNERTNEETLITNFRNSKVITKECVIINPHFNWHNSLLCECSASREHSITGLGKSILWNSLRWELTTKLSLLKNKRTRQIFNRILLYFALKSFI